MATIQAAKRTPARNAKTSAKAGVKMSVKTGANKAKEFVSPATVTLPSMPADGNDTAFRETIYLMALAFDRLHSCREAFGRTLTAMKEERLV